MVLATIALGSNIPPRKKHLREAVALLDELKSSRIVAKSRIYETAPVGGPDQGMFLNAAIDMETGLPVEELLENLLGIERSLGRVRTVRNGPRIIDLDIIFYDTLCFDLPDLIVPHPRFRDRGFVLLPLCDFRPEFIDPSSGKTVAELLNEWQRKSDEACTVLDPL